MGKLIKIDAELALSEEKKGDDLLSPLSKDIYLFTTKIAGHYRLVDPSPFLTLGIGEAISLKRSASKYDPNEILMEKEGLLVGYVPEVDEVIFARLMDAGKYLFGKVKSKSFSHNTPQFEVDIFLRDF